MEFIIKTKTTVKYNDRGRWWIDRNLIPEIRVSAENTREALEAWKEAVEERYIDVSKTALRRKSPMYIDGPDGEAVQIGFVITGKTGFPDGRKWVERYIDCWVELLTVSRPDFVA